MFNIEYTVMNMDKRKLFLFFSKDMKEVQMDTITDLNIENTEFSYHQCEPSIINLKYFL